MTPTVPSAEDFSALALSSPWLWSTLHLRRRDARLTAEAWVARPAYVRVEAPGRAPYVHRELGEAPAREEPVRRSDGLVVHRPGQWGFAPRAEEPFYENYLFTAMLDPVELAHGVAVDDVWSSVRAGRETWWARLVALEGYDPCCSCCPLLWSEASDLAEYGASGRRERPTATWPSAYDVGLDRATGIVVSLQPVDHPADHLWFETEVLDVDAPVV